MADFLKSAWPWLVALAVSAALALFNLNAITDRPVRSDDHQNTRMAYHLATSGVISYAHRPDQELTPTMRREPVPTIALAMFYRLHPRLSPADSLQDVTAGPKVRYIKQVNIVWAFLLFVGIFALTRCVVSNTYGALALAAFIAVMTSICLTYPRADRVFTEIQGSTLLVWSSVALYWFLQRRTLTSALVFGAALGLLALTKATFLYIGIVALIVVAVFLWLQQRPSTKDRSREVTMAERLAWLRLPVAAAAVFAVLCGAWMTRNYIHFQQFTMSERGGDILYYRLLKMEYPALGAVYLWSPRPYRPFVGALTGYGPDDIAPNGVVGGLSRSNGDLALHRRRWDIYLDRMEGAGLDPQSMSRQEMESWLEHAALQAYASNPVHYAKWVLVFAYRGSFAGANRLKFLDEFGDAATPYHLSFLLFLNFLIVGVGGVITRSVRLLPLFLLPVGLYLFHAMFTYNITRYNEPLIPFLWLAAAITLGGAISAGAGLLEKNKSAPSSELAESKKNEH